MNPNFEDHQGTRDHIQGRIQPSLYHDMLLIIGTDSHPKRVSQRSTVLGYLLDYLTYIGIFEFEKRLPCLQ